MAKTSTGSAKARAAWMVAALVAVVGTVAAFLAPQLVRGRALATASARAESLVVDGLGSKLEKSDVNAAIDDKRYAEIDSYLDGLIGPGFPVLERDPGHPPHGGAAPLRRPPGGRPPQGPEAVYEVTSRHPRPAPARHAA